MTENATYINRVDVRTCVWNVLCTVLHKALVSAVLVFPMSVLTAQTLDRFSPGEPVDGQILYRDSERWIKERYRWFYEQRVYPEGRIPEKAREQAWLQAKSMSVYKPSVLMKSGAAMAQTWTNVGPANIGGRVTGIAIHPTNPDVVYFTAADGGVWRSTNGGSAFMPIADDLPTLAMGSMHLDPQNPTRIFVGTGEANGSGDCYPGIGVVASEDGGATWLQKGAEFSDNIGKIRVHKSQNNIVIAACFGGVYRSTDGGSTWTRIFSGKSHDLVQHPTQHNIWYAATEKAGVKKSTDAGATWTNLSIGVASDSIGRMALDICLSTPATLYAVVVSAKGSSALKAIVKTTDNGATWKRLETQDTPNFFSTYGWYNCELAVDPFDPNRILIGGVGLYLSENGGATWGSRSGIHVDQHAIEFSPSQSGIVYLGNDGGMYKSTDGGKTYASLNGNLPITQFYELFVAQQDSDIMMGGTQDNGSKRRKSATSVWNNATGGDGGYCIIDYSDARYLYTEYQNGSHQRSTNGGTNWHSINAGLVGSSPWVTPVVIHPTDPTVLFTCTNKQLHKTTNRGTQWFSFHGNMDSTSTINVIAISQSNPAYMAVGYTNGRVWKSTNSGASWSNISGGLPSRRCMDILFNPSDPNTIYVCYSGYNAASVYKTNNGTSPWTNISGNLPSIPKNALEINPYDTSMVFVGTDFGVYSTTNSGATWQILSDGMPKVVVVDLEMHKASGKLRAATHGRSIYELAVYVPVELTAFSARFEGSSSILDWRTSGETNNYGFSVERKSGVAGQWTEIGFVPGAGTSSQVNLYSFIDDKLPMDTREVTYRLRQVDYDGAYEYSPEVTVLFPGALAGSMVLEQNYPNPFNPVTTIRYTIAEEGEAKIVITDAKGSLVAEPVAAFHYPGSYAVAFDAKSLPTGSYFYHLISGAKRLTRTMMVMK